MKTSDLRLEVNKCESGVVVHYGSGGGYGREGLLHDVSEWRVFTDNSEFKKWMGKWFQDNKCGAEDE